MVSINRLKHWHLYEAMPVPCLILTTDFIVVAANECYLEENHLSKRQAIGASLMSLLQLSSGSSEQLISSFKKVLQKPGASDVLELAYQLSISLPALKEEQFRSIKNVSFSEDDDGTVTHILHFAVKINAATRFLADITRNIADPIVTTDKDLNITRWNKAAQQMFGWTKEEAIGKNTIDILRAQLKPEARSKIISAINTGGYWQGEVTYLTKTDIEKFALCTVSVFRDANEHITGNLILIKDITKRKEAEQALALLNEELEKRVEERTASIIATEEKYRRLFENNPLPMWVLNQSDFRIMAVNDMAILHYGYSREEFLSMTAFDIRPLEDREKFLHSDHSSTTETNYNKGIWRHKKKNGDIIFVEVRVHDTVFENLQAKMILAHDVTDKIKAEQELAASELRYRTTLNDMMEGVQILDFNWKYIYLNDTIVNTSKNVRDEMLGYTIMEKYPGIEHTNVFKIMQQVMKEREPQQVENEFVFPDGTVSFFQLSIQPVPEGIFVLSLDITERKNAEMEMAKSQASRQIIMQRISDSFIALDTNWNYIYVNKAAGKMVNQEPDELLGKNMFEKFPELKGHQLEKAFKKAMQTQEHVHVQEYYQPLDLWLESNIYPSPEGLSIFFADISQRKRDELHRTQMEENLKAIFDNSSEGFILTDKNGIVKLYNNKIVDSFLQGVSDEIKQEESIFNLVEPESKTFFEEVFHKVLAGETIEFTRRYKKIDGEETWINLIINPVVKNNSIEGVCVSARDVTAQKNAREDLKKSFEENLALAERLSAILNNIPAHIALINEDGVIMEVNESWCQFNAEWFNGKEYTVGANYLHNDGQLSQDKQHMHRGVKEVLANELDEFVYEYSVEENDQTYWYRKVVTSLKVGAHTGAAIMHMDISEIRRMEAERMQQQQELQRQVTLAILHGQEKERNNIGKELHDNINQILAGARMYLSIAANKDEMVKEGVKYPIELLDKSIEEIRLLCRSMVTPMENIPLEDVINQLLETIKQANVNVLFSYSIEGNLVSDELKLNIYRIMQELSQNILKYANADEMTVEITVKNNALHLMVSDNGNGFDVQAKKAGIGISNIRNRVKSFAGNIRINSEIGRGTSTNIIIPLQNKVAT